MPGQGPFYLKPSRQGLILLTAAFIFSGIIILFQEISFFYKSALLLILFIYWARTIKYFQAIQCLTYLGDGRWQLVFLDGRPVYARLCGESTVTRFVSVLRFKPNGRWYKQSCLIFRDSLQEGQYRALLVLLRFGQD